MKRDQLNDTYLEFVEKQRLYFKTVKDFQEVQYHALAHTQSIYFLPTFIKRRRQTMQFAKAWPDAVPVIVSVCIEL